MYLPKKEKEAMGLTRKILNQRPWSQNLFSESTQYGHSQSEKKLGVGDKYHRSIKVHTYLGGTESASIEIPPFRPKFT